MEYLLFSTSNPVKTLVRGSKQITYYFQTLTLPYFTRIRFNWYPLINGKAIKTLPDNISALLTPLAIAHWVMVVLMDTVGVLVASHCTRIILLVQK